MSWLVVILITVVIIGVAAYFGYNKNKQLMGEGKIVARKGTYWEEEHLFTTGTTYDNLLDAIGKTDFSDCKAEVIPNANGQMSVLFKSSHAWNAEVDYLGEQDGKNQYKFYFVAWQTRNGMPYNVTSMNMILTSIEKLFFSLDPTTTVRSQRAQIKSKTKFF